MSSKEQTPHSPEASSKGQLAKPTVNLSESSIPQTHLTMLLQQAGLGPKALTPQTVLHLQRTIGNRATQKLLPRPALGHSRRLTGAAQVLQRAALEEEKDLQLKPLKDSIQHVPQETVQTFWVKEGGKEPRWEADESLQKNYVKTKDTWWNRWHWIPSPIFVPPTPETIKTTTPEQQLDFTGLDFAAMMKLCAAQKIPFKQQMLFAIEHYSATVTIDLLRPYIEQASQTERDTVWQDKSLISKAKAKLSLDTYLALLPALRVFNQPATKISEAQGKWVSHMRGDEADKYIRARLGPLVAGAVKANRQVEGEVSVVDDAEWVIAFERQWGKTISPSVANAFVDVSLPKRHIWIHKDRGNAGTVVHEGMHKYASATLRDELIRKYPGTMPISQLDEGITEYFTREVTGPLGIVRGNYQKPFLVTDQLVALVGRDTVAKAYFDGDFDGLKQAYLAKKIGTTLTDWETFARAIEEQRFSAASSCL